MKLNSLFVLREWDSFLLSLLPDSESQMPTEILQSSFFGQRARSGGPPRITIFRFDDCPVVFGMLGNGNDRDAGIAADVLEVV